MEQICRQCDSKMDEITNSTMTQRVGWLCKHCHSLGKPLSDSWIKAIGRETKIERTKNESRKSD